MSKPSRLARPSSANVTSKLPVSRIEDFNRRSRKISLGEKILRAGSEGSLVKKQQQVPAAHMAAKKPGANSAKGTVLPSSSYISSFKVTMRFILVGSICLRSFLTSR